jgi:hypothetical protein
MGERRVVNRVLVGKPQEKSQLERPRLRRENNIKIDLQDLRCGGMDWIDLARKQVSGTFECGNELSGAIKYEEFLE